MKAKKKMLHMTSLVKYSDNMIIDEILRKICEGIEEKPRNFFYYSRQFEDWFFRRDNYKECNEG